MNIIRFRPFKFKINNRWFFKPGIYSSSITLLLLPGFVYLGFWQLNRSQYKEQLTTTYQTQQQQVPNKWQPEHSLILDNDIEPLLLKRFEIEGQMTPEIHILLDNQIHQGKVGFQVYNLFKPNTASHYILVDRGFIALNGKNRKDFAMQIISDLTIQTETKRISGIFTSVPKGIRLNSKALIESSVVNQLIIQQLDYQMLSEYLQVPLATLIFKLDPLSPNSFTFTPLYFGLPYTKHLAYALQWFTLALAVVVYYFVINVHRDEIKG